MIGSVRGCKMAVKIILRKVIDSGKILALFPEIPGGNIDECLIYDENGEKFVGEIKSIIKTSKKIDKDHVVWLVEKLEKEFGKLKLVKKEHPEDFNKRFKKLSFFR